MTRQTFQVPVAHDVIKFKHIADADLIKIINVWSAASAQVLAGPGVQLGELFEIAINKDTKKWRISGAELSGNPVWFWMPDDVLMGEYEVQYIKDYMRVVPLFDIAECVQNVVGWSTARGILENGVWYTQGTKLYEEDGEAATGVGKNKHPFIMDGIGDALVVLVNLMELTGYEAMDIPGMVSANRRSGYAAGNAHYLFHKMRHHITCAIDRIWDEVGIDSPKKVNFKTFDNGACATIEYHYEEMLDYADALANAYDMTLEQCFSLAWDEIKDRKGFLNADGIFIKESDAK